MTTEQAHQLLVIAVYAAIILTGILWMVGKILNAVREQTRELSKRLDGLPAVKEPY